jgi:hypothetical protein
MEKKQMKEFMTVRRNHPTTNPTTNTPHLDVPKPRPTLLRRLHQRLQLKVPRIQRRKLCHALRRQTLEESGTIGKQIPGAECCHDASWFASWTIDWAIYG